MTTQSAHSIAQEANSVRPLGELLRRALGLDFTSSAPNIHDICIDSRVARRGSLFVALPGSVVDGSRFAADAVRRGAAAVLAESDLELPAGVPCVRVADARAAASKIAAEFHGLRRIQERGRLRVVGITGTNGKTTTAYLLRSILRGANHPTAMLGTIEYDLVDETTRASLTTPDPITLVRHLVHAFRAGARYAVMEVSSHSLAQQRTAGITFAAGVFTNLTQDHLDYHDSMEDYFLAKRRLFDELPASAAAIVNTDDRFGRRMIERFGGRVIQYGLGEEADVSAGAVSESIQGVRFSLRSPQSRADIGLSLVGRHNVYNALAAAAAGLSLNLPFEAVTAGLASIRNVPGRLQRVDTRHLGCNVFVDYAHTDDALRNALGALRPLTSGKLKCLFGCGGDRDKTKRPLMARAVAEIADSFIITSDNPRTEDPIRIIEDIKGGLSRNELAAQATEPDRAVAITRAIEELGPSDTLLIAGKGHEDYQILGNERIHFDDVEAAQGAIDRIANARTNRPSAA